VEQDCVVLLVMGWCVSRWIRPSRDSVLDWEMLINVCLLATEKVYTTFFGRFLKENYVGENYVGVVALWVNLGIHFDGR
jgi:hypothetical protein